MKRILCLLLSLCMVLAMPALLSGCADKSGESFGDDIIILFTNDVHGNVDENIGYAGLAAYKKEMQAISRYVTLVDCGDFSQGGYLNTVSNGEYAVECMNIVGYDFVTCGNHEFGNSIPQLVSNIEKLNAQTLCCNLKYTGKGENPFKDIKPYSIAEYGDVKVGFIGVTTPLAMASSVPTYFKENGETVYSFCKENDGMDLYQTVQENVDACRNDGADYIVLLSHLGQDMGTDPYMSSDVIANTTGIDVVLDAHSHYEIPCDIEKNKDGKDVLLASTGTALNNIGRLVISPNGLFSVGYISKYETKDEATVQQLTEIKKRYESGKLDEKIATLDFSMKCYDEKGIRLIRNRETTIGNLVADAYRWCGGTDISFANGGGIRADLSAGDVLCKDLIAVNPYDNPLCVIEVTGEELLDMLEYFYRKTDALIEKDGKSYGEDGSFQHISGLQLTIDTSLKSTVTVDENDMLVSVGDTRRVKNVRVLKNGEYIALDPTQVYTVTTTDYMAKNGGCGMENILADNEVLLDSFIANYQSIIDYIKYLSGDFSAYRNVEGRITVE